MGTKLAYFIASIGRSTTKALVDKLHSQMEPGDELFVVGDGPQPVTREMMAEYQRPDTFYLEFGPTKHWGTEQLDYAVPLSHADFHCFIGDDDDILPNTLASIRKRVAEVPPQPHIFSMLYMGGVLSNSVEAGEVSGQQIVVPNDPTRRVKWADNHTELSDWFYIQMTLLAWKDVGFKFQKEPICVLLNRNRGAII